MPVSDAAVPGAGRAPALAWRAAWLIVIACAALFVLRGPLRATDPGVNMDAPLLLSAAATWAHGGNPYDTSAVAAQFGTDAARIAPTLERGRQAFVYPPPAYALLSPLTWLSWPLQRPAWNLLNTGLYLASLWLTLRLFGLRLRSLAGLALLAIGLAGNPAHICIALGQTGIAVYFLVCASWCLQPVGSGRAGRPLLAGLALGLALMIKPQFALVFVAYDLYAGRTRVAIGAALVALTALGASLALHPQAVELVHTWLDNARLLMSGDADPLHVRFPHQLINLESPLAVLTGLGGLARWLSLAVCATLALTYATADRRLSRVDADANADANADADANAIADPHGHWLTGVAFVATLSLLVFYHRIYDAVFLLAPAALALRRIARHDTRGWLLLGLLAPLFVPVSSIVIRLLSGPEGPTPVVIGALPMALLVQHQTWCLLLACLVIIAMRRRHATVAARSTASP